jgi:hypothetical protein
MTSERCFVLLYVLLALSLAYLFVVWFCVKMVKKLQGEVAYLPKDEEDKSSIFTQFRHPGEGLQMHGVIEETPETLGKPVVLMLAVSTCGHCQSQLEEFLELREEHGRIPFLCLMKSVEEQTMYEHKFTGAMPTQVVSHRMLGEEYFITSSPSFVLLTPQRMIIKIVPAAKPAYWMFRQLMMDALAS